MRAARIIESFSALAEGVEFEDPAAVLASVSVCRLPSEATIIDIGCGQGQVALALARGYPRAHVTGIDLSLAQVEKARAAAQRAGVHNVSFQAADWMDFPLLSSPADLIIAAQVFQFTSEPNSFLQRIASSLKPGAHLLLSTILLPNDEPAQDRARRLWHRWIDCAVSFHSGQDLAFLLAGAGLACCRIEVHDILLSEQSPERTQAWRETIQALSPSLDDQGSALQTVTMLAVRRPNEGSAPGPEPATRARPLPLAEFFTLMSPMLLGRASAIETATRFRQAGVPFADELSRLVLYEVHCRQGRFEAPDALFPRSRSALRSHGGSGCWEQLVEGYLAVHRSLHFEMNARWEAFPTFLAERALAQMLPPWIGELADFEWQSWRAHVAPDVPSDARPEEGLLRVSAAAVVRRYDHDFIGWLDEEGGEIPQKRECFVLFFRDRALVARRDRASPAERLLLTLITEDAAPPQLFLHRQGIEREELERAFHDLHQAGILLGKVL